MDKNIINSEADTTLLFWVAYKRDGEKYNYIGDGKGSIRLFKTRQALSDYLLLNAPDLVGITIQSVVGAIALPEVDSKDGALIPIKRLAPDGELIRRIVGRKRHKKKST